MCTSSIIYTLYLALEGRNMTSSQTRRILSTLLFEAASISITSISVLSRIPRQISQVLQGFPLTGDKQLIALEKILAMDVLPVPRVPQKR